MEVNIKQELATLDRNDFDKVNDLDYSEKECLVDLNDFGRKFNTIANIIEKNWENL